MKKIILLVIAALFTFSCSSEPLTTDPGAISKTNDSTAKFASSTKSPSAASTSNWGDYNIAVSVSTDGSEWTYTITKAKSSA